MTSKKRITKPKALPKVKEVKSNAHLIAKLFELGHKWCCVCGSTSQLTFSHFYKDSTMKGNSRWEYNNLQNGAMMCMTCHGKFDGLSNSFSPVDPYTRVGFLLSTMKDEAYAKRIAKRMRWLIGDHELQEKVHKDISND